MKKIVLAFVLLALAAVPAAAATGSHAAARRNHVVLLKDVRIHPSTLRVARGDSVTWVWGDESIETEHNVTSSSGRRFHSSPTQLTGTYKVTFVKQGTYGYECTIHPEAMRGKIIVG